MVLHQTQLKIKHVILKCILSVIIINYLIILYLQESGKFYNKQGLIQNYSDLTERVNIYRVSEYINCCHIFIFLVKHYFTLYHVTNAIQSEPSLRGLDPDNLQLRKVGSRQDFMGLRIESCVWSRLQSRHWSRLQMGLSPSWSRLQRMSSIKNMGLYLVVRERTTKVQEGSASICRHIFHCPRNY